MTFPLNSMGLPPGGGILGVQNRDTQLIPLASVALDGTEEASQQMARAVSERVIATMTHHFNKPPSEANGVWYPDEYDTHLREKMGIAMNPLFYSGCANDQYFEKTSRFTFSLKQGKQASEGILRFLEGPTVADCGNAIIACHYKTMLDILGEDRFNQIFLHYPLVIDQELGGAVLSALTQFSDDADEGKRGNRPLQVGDACHFSGISWYEHKHPEGFGGGSNVIYVGNNAEGQQLFMGHRFQKLLTEEQIYDRCLEMYNQERTPQEESRIESSDKKWIYSKENAELKHFYVVPPEEFKKDLSRFSDGFVSECVRTLDPHKLLRLKTAPDVQTCMAELISEHESEDL